MCPRSYKKSEACLPKRRIMQERKIGRKASKKIAEKKEKLDGKQARNAKEKGGLCKEKRAISAGFKNSFLPLLQVGFSYIKGRFCTILESAFSAFCGIILLCFHSRFGRNFQPDFKACFASAFLSVFGLIFLRFSDLFLSDFSLHFEI